MCNLGRSYFPGKATACIEKALLAILLLTVPVLLFGSCTAETQTSPSPQVLTPSPETGEITQTETELITQEPETPVLVSPSQEGQLSFSATPQIAELKDVNWISPGKVTVENLYPGANAEYPITVHNGSDNEVVFAVTARQPDNVTENYEALPEAYLSWVTVSQPRLSLKAKETADVLITVTIPGDATYTNKKAEFWISIIDQSEEGMVRTELAARWLISTK